MSAGGVVFLLLAIHNITPGQISPSGRRREVRSDDRSEFTNIVEEI